MAKKLVIEQWVLIIVSSGTKQKRQCEFRTTIAKMAKGRIIPIVYARTDT